MKETTLYICEICKERYVDQKEAENCEAAHIKPKRLTKKDEVSPVQERKRSNFNPSTCISVPGLDRH